MKAIPNCLCFLLLLVTLHSNLANAKEVKIEEVAFQSHGVTLHGSIAFSEDNKSIASIVFVDGSGKNERRMAVAKAFAEDGITALVYDKRGAGKSGGVYEDELSVSETNLSLLVDDAIAALRTLRDHPKNKSATIGLVGESQGGWIVPLAAEKSSIPQFMALWSGPVCKTSEEDIFSSYTKDKDLESKLSYESALAMRSTPYAWPKIMGRDTDPSDSLRKLNIPGLWIFGGKDGSIPVDLSIERLTLLNQAGGKNYRYVLFSDLGHNTHWTSHATVVSWIKDVAKDLETD